MLNNDKVHQEKEIHSWKDNGVFEIVDDEGKKLISVRWIIKKEKKIYISQC